MDLVFFFSCFHGEMPFCFQFPSYKKHVATCENASFFYVLRIGFGIPNALLYIGKRCGGIV